eukprot:COSAG01_NODE_42556_length_438_cov_74.713864_2_plen_65_part_01
MRHLFGCVAQVTVKTLSLVRSNDSAPRCASHAAVLPLLHCFVDEIRPATLPDWDADLPEGRTGND